MANRNRVATHRSRTPAVNARVAPEGTRADNINLTVSAIGVITGSGTISPAGALAFKMVAALSGGVVGGLTKVAGIGGGGGQSQIPFAEPRSKPVTKPLAGGSQ